VTVGTPEFAASSAFAWASRSPIAAAVASCYREDCSHCSLPDTAAAYPCFHPYSHPYSPYYPYPYWGRTNQPHCSPVVGKVGKVPSCSFRLPAVRPDRTVPSCCWVHPCSSDFRPSCSGCTRPSRRVNVSSAGSDTSPSSDSSVEVRPSGCSFVLPSVLDFPSDNPWDVADPCSRDPSCYWVHPYRTQACPVY